MSFKPTVCHCLNAGGYGGIQRIVNSLVEEQCRDRRVGVLFAQYGDTLASAIAAQGLPVLALRLKGGFDINPVAIIRAIRFFRDFDVVHIHSFNYVFMLAALLSYSRTVFTFHGMTDLRRKLNWRDRVKKISLNYAVGHCIQGVTTVSHFMKMNIIERFGRIGDVIVVQLLSDSSSTDLSSGDHAP